MIKTLSKYSAFTMIELLIALAILAIAVVIVTPKFLNIQSQAKDIVAANMAADLNNTYADWLNAGGQATNTNPATSNGLLAMNGTDSSDFKNGGTSTKFTFPLPSSLSLSTTNPQSVVDINGIAVAYNPATGKFAAVELPTDGSPVEIGSYVASVDPTSGAFYWSGLPATGTFTSIGSTLVAVNSNGQLVTTAVSSTGTGSNIVYLPIQGGTPAMGMVANDEGRNVILYGNYVNGQFQVNETATYEYTNTDPTNLLGLGRIYSFNFYFPNNGGGIPAGLVGGAVAAP